MEAGEWVFGGGLYSCEDMSLVAADGAVTNGPYPESKAYVGRGMAYTAQRLLPGSASRITGRFDGASKANENVAKRKGST